MPKDLLEYAEDEKKDEPKKGPSKEDLSSTLEQKLADRAGIKDLDAFKKLMKLCG